MTRNGCAASRLTARSAAISLRATASSSQPTNRELGVSNRDLGTIERIDGNADQREDGRRERAHRHLRRRADAALRSWLRRDLAQLPGAHRRPGIGEHGHEVHPELINTRFAYVSVSRASEDVRIYTNDAADLGERLSTDVTKTSAVDLQKAQVEPTHNQQTQTKEPPMTNSREHSQEELRRQTCRTIFTHPKTSAPLPNIEQPAQCSNPSSSAKGSVRIRVEARDRRSPELPAQPDAGSWLHIDPQGQFYDRQAQPITRETALEQAGQSSAHSSVTTHSLSQQRSNNNDQGISL